MSISRDTFDPTKNYKRVRYHQDTNPTGEVLTPGYLYEVKNIPDFNKTSDTRVELVGVIKI